MNLGRGFKRGPFFLRMVTLGRVNRPSPLGGGESTPSLFDMDSGSGFISKESSTPSLCCSSRESSSISSRSSASCTCWVVGRPIGTTEATPVIGGGDTVSRSMYGISEGVIDIAPDAVDACLECIDLDLF